MPDRLDSCLSPRRIRHRQDARCLAPLRYHFPHRITSCCNADDSHDPNIGSRSTEVDGRGVQNVEPCGRDRRCHLTSYV